MNTPVFYTDKMAVYMPGHISKSTYKPKLFVDALDESFAIHQFAPIEKSNFYYAHTPKYVDNFFDGVEPFASSAGFIWSEAYAESQLYTVGSLYAAIQHVLHSEQKFAIAPVSGFHHATPKSGKMFCSFSGQVIASVKTYLKDRLVGAYLDLDSHYGNSIDDTLHLENNIEHLTTKVSDCIKFNINPKGNYMSSLRSSLLKIKKAALAEEIHYLVYCHGADSIIGDELGYGQCTEEEWFVCTELVAEMCKEINLPLVLCLFGGYGDMKRIVDLHYRDAKLLQSYLL